MVTVPGKSVGCVTRPVGWLTIKLMAITDARQVRECRRCLRVGLAPGAGLSGPGRKPSRLVIALCGLGAALLAAASAVAGECEFDPMHRTAGPDVDPVELSVEELTARLRAFEPCLEVASSGSQAGAAGASGGPPASGADASVENGDGQQGEDDATQSTANAMDSESDADETSDALAGVVAEQNQGDDRSSPSGKPGGAPVVVRNELAEDDAARMLWEAAELETDPAIKASLQQHYQDYVNRR